MIKVKDPMLFGLIHGYFVEYLPKQKRSSRHTIKAYRAAMNTLLEFTQREKGVSLHEVTFKMIDSSVLANFLESLETKGCSVATRNHRLNCIRSFYNYAAKMEPTAIFYREEIQKVPKKNNPKLEIVEYMSETAVKTILEQPNIRTKKGLRDQFLMILLYDTGARIQELMDIQLKDIHAGKTPTVILHGKGGKPRTVPLMEKTMEHFRRYLDVYHKSEQSYSNHHLFYTRRNGENSRMCEDTARRFMRSYGTMAQKLCPEVPDNVHPHLWRHSRAMHLYQNGMDLVLVSQWLGHAKLDTTLIYAHADTEQKRRAIEAATAQSSALHESINVQRYTISEDDVIRQLYGLL
jgi:site-specific recombinase XerD